MTYKEAKLSFNEIWYDYAGINRPKYKHADLELLVRHYNTLQELKRWLYDYARYLNLLNGLSQTIAKIKKTKNPSYRKDDNDWNNISEHGFNKDVRILKGQKRDPANTVDWEDKYGRQSMQSDANFSARHFAAVDAVAYLWMLQVNDRVLPQSCEPIFNNTLALQKFLNKPVPVPDDSMVEVSFNDHYFRKFSGFKYSSSRICKLLEDVAECDFKLTYPVMMVGESGSKKETEVVMPSFSRLFTLTVNVEKRSDGKIGKRIYKVSFNTLLGMLFIHNLKMKNYGFISSSIYGMNHSAQIFYRKYILSNNHPVSKHKLSNIEKALSFDNSNKTVVENTIKENVLSPLKENSLLSEFEIKDGLEGKIIVIKIQRE
ncbi:hypothetical protein KAI46_07455 [bacterium]|nr:hypothetical protein [bacterium]